MMLEGISTTFDKSSPADKVTLFGEHARLVKYQFGQPTRGNKSDVCYPIDLPPELAHHGLESHGYFSILLRSSSFQ